MKFTIQANIGESDQVIYNGIRNLPHQYVKIIPFSHELITDIPLEGTDYIPYGSTTLSNIAVERKWTGVHANLNVMNYRTARANHKHMLNDNVVTVDQALDFLAQQEANTKWFCRPSNDLKQFAGHTTTTKALVDWLKDAMEIQTSECPTGLDSSTEIVVSSVKPINMEWRWFIVGGQIVAGSTYRVRNQLRSILERNPEVIAEAQNLADIWLPDSCVVMDTALLATGEVKVIEFNSINSSGFYAVDPGVVFNALYDYHK